MSWSCGIVGLPNAGKSTLFKAITALDVTIESYPFSTIDPNKAVVSLPDRRLPALAELSSAVKVTPATIEITDVAGLVKGASRGEGLGNQFLGHLRNVDLLIHVVGGYNRQEENNETTMEKLGTVNFELCLADIEVIERRRDKLEPKAKSGDKKARSELNLLVKTHDYLNRGMMLSGVSFSDEEADFLAGLSLLTRKKIIYVYNTDEDSLFNPDLSGFHENEEVIPICASLEAELAELPEEDKKVFLDAYGMQSSRIDELLDRCFKMLDLAVFYTIKGSETRAWVVPSGMAAVKAAGKVHTDMERGFINVEVIPWHILLASGSISRARERGLCRTEGRDYPVEDGDVLFFRFRSD
ncbi:MAG TPA: redox-regulated ATPase YchF [Firmicutes bacterium]|nr:redox-regulated ATPase YchF [Bacillota bacterium]